MSTPHSLPSALRTLALSVSALTALSWLVPAVVEIQAAEPRPSASTDSEWDIPSTTVVYEAMFTQLKTFAQTVPAGQQVALTLAKLAEVPPARGDQPLPRKLLPISEPQFFGKAPAGAELQFSVTEKVAGPRPTLTLRSANPGATLIVPVRGLTPGQTNAVDLTACEVICLW